MMATQTAANITSIPITTNEITKAESEKTKYSQKHYGNN